MRRLISDKVVSMYCKMFFNFILQQFVFSKVPSKAHIWENYKELTGDLACNDI